MDSSMDSILVIEDDDTLRLSMCDYLEDRGYRVVSALDGKTGVDMFLREQTDLVMTDLRMPGTDGFEVLRRIGKISPDTPMIVVSGVGRIQEAVDALHLGAWDYVIKPVEDMTIINHTVRKALEHSRLVRQNREYHQELEQKVIERTRELEEANNHLAEINTRLKKIFTTTRELSACEELDTLGDMLLNGFAKNLLATGGSLWFKEENGLRRLRSLDAVHAPQFLPFPLRPDSVLKRVLDLGSPILIQDIASEPGLKSSGWNGYKDGSLLVFPVPDSKGTVTAVLTLHSKISPPFIEQDREVGSILAAFGSEVLRVNRIIKDLRESKKELAQERNLFSQIAETSPVGITKLDREGSIIYTNSTAELILGNAKIGLKDRSYNDPEWRISDVDGRPYPEENLPFNRVKRTGEPVFDVQHAIELADGNRRIVSVNAVPLKDDNGDFNGMISVVEDITRRRQAEQRIQQELREKNLLLQEVHHRVNNNLQIILSLLNLQSDYCGDRACEVLRDATERVRVYSSINERLRHDVLKSSVDFSDFLLCHFQDMCTIFKRNPRYFKLDLEMKENVIGLEQAVPAAMLLHELMVCSFRNSFADADHGSIRIIIKLDTFDAISEIVYFDNGSPIEDNRDSFSAKIVDVMSSQLHLKNNSVRGEPEKYRFTVIG